MNPMTDIVLEKKVWILGSIFYGVLFTILDTLNVSYDAMYRNYGLTLVILQIGLNLLMSVLSGLLLALNKRMLEVKGIQTHGEHLSVIAVIVGILTYGCTPCVISFFASFGIAFSVAVLPYAGLPYKLLTLGLICLGVLITFFEMRRKSCTIRLRRN